MSTERESAGDPRRWSDEDLLQWVLDASLRERYPRETLVADAGTAARLEELESFLASCRDSLAAETETRRRPAEDAVLVARILATTTREDLSWSGDLRLVGGFLRDRLRSSRLLRFVAASLLLHLIALPVLAYYTLVVLPEKRGTILHGPGGALELPWSEVEEEPDLPIEEPVIETLDSLDAYDLLRERLARAGHLERLDAPAAGERMWDDSLGLVLWCEAQLDWLEGHVVVPGSERHREARLALEALEPVLRGGGGGDPLQRLAASAWLRGRGVGVIEGGDPELLAICRRRLGGDAPLAPEAWRRDFRAASTEEE